MMTTGAPLKKNAGYDKQTNSYDVSPFIRDYLGIKEATSDRNEGDLPGVQGLC